LPGHGHDGFFARGPSGERSFLQHQSPFHDRPSCRLTESADRPGIMIL
jgi:hypothetical protein